MTYKRIDIQNILETNPLNINVTYKDRPSSNPDSFITYHRVPNVAFNADNKIYKNKTTIQISHFHKNKLESLESFLNDCFSAQMIYDFKEEDTDYIHTIYQFDCFIGDWYGQQDY
ncbi:hypothetical protein LJB88_04555 [Erysipelotrichaceae bacterium OttesenSCG-928-M19]|nr:hypothetical protein [Erysipelotrichaceae bacterium OttesenSCG-928-M19]